MSYYDRIKEEVKSQGGEEATETGSDKQSQKKLDPSQTDSKGLKGGKESESQEGSSQSLGDGFLPGTAAEEDDSADDQSQESREKEEDSSMNLNDDRGKSDTDNRAKRQTSGRDSSQAASSPPEDSPFSKLIEESQESYGGEDAEADENADKGKKVDKEATGEDEGSIEVLSDRSGKEADQSQSDSKKEVAKEEKLADRSGKEAKEEQEVSQQQLVSNLKEIKETNRQLLQVLQEINGKL